VEKQVRR